MAENIPEPITLLSYLVRQDWEKIKPWINTPNLSKSAGTFLNWLITRGHPNEALKLIEHFNNDQNGRLNMTVQLGKNKENPLHFLVQLLVFREENYLILERLIKLEPNLINQQTNDGLTPIMYNFAKPSDHTNYEMEKLLLQNGADPNIASKDYGNALDVACNSNKNLELVKLLLSVGAKPSASCLIRLFSIPQIRTIQANQANQINPNIPIILEELIKAGADPLDQKTFPLGKAVLEFKRCGIETVKILIGRGADLNTLLKDGTSLLMLACHDGNFDLVKFLIEEGHADINLPSTGSKQTAIFYAIEKKRVEIVKYLAELEGINLKHQNHIGHTPLFRSIDDNFSIEIATYLYKKSPPEVFTLRSNKGNSINTLLESKKYELGPSVLVSYFKSLRDTSQPQIKVNFEEHVCIICRDTLDAKVCAIKCGHKYHIRCLSNYQEKSNKNACPLCNVPS